MWGGVVVQGWEVLAGGSGEAGGGLPSLPLVCCCSRTSVLELLSCCCRPLFFVCLTPVACMLLMFSGMAALMVVFVTSMCKQKIHREWKDHPA